jgi:ADP-heptose:LPS heptosyltransferase
VLIVRLDAIGDFVLWVEAARALRTIYPPDKYEITLVGNEIWGELAEKLSIADHYFFINKEKFRRNLLYRYKVLKQIRMQGFSIAIQPTFSRRFETGDSIIRVSGASTRIGSVGDLSNMRAKEKRQSDKWYTQLIPNDNQVSTEIERNTAFIRKLGVADFLAKPPQLNYIGSLPSDFHLTDYYILFVGAGWNGRQWPTHNFVKLSRRIYEMTGWIGVICGGSEEVSIGTAITHDAGVPMQNWVGRTSLTELVGIIYGSCCLVGNESSGIHISSAVSTPSVCILGGGHYGKFLPYGLKIHKNNVVPEVVVHKMDCFGCNWHCIYDLSHNEAVPCIKNISVDAAWKAVQRVIVDAD